MNFVLSLHHYNHLWSMVEEILLLSSDVLKTHLLLFNYEFCIFIPLKRKKMRVWSSTGQNWTGGGPFDRMVIPKFTKVSLTCMKYRLCTYTTVSFQFYCTVKQLNVCFPRAVLLSIWMYQYDAVTLVHRLKRKHQRTFFEGIKYFLIQTSKDHKANVLKHRVKIGVTAIEFFCESKDNNAANCLLT